MYMRRKVLLWADRYINIVIILISVELLLCCTAEKGGASDTTVTWCKYLPAIPNWTMYSVNNDAYASQLFPLSK